MTVVENRTPQDHELSLSIIRDFELSCGGDLVTMPRSVQRLIGFVALHDRPVRRSLVRGTLWLDSPEERANASLRSALWRVPAPGGVRVVSSSVTHLWLNPCVQVDFRTILARAFAVLDAADRDVTAIDVGRHLGAFGGDLLAGWYDDWVLLERERFHHLRLQALDRLGDQLYVAGALSDALQVGLVALHAEPLHERAHRLVMRIHLKQGNVGEAVQHFRRYERTLARDVGAVPSDDMLQLVRPYLIRRHRVDMETR